MSFSLRTLLIVVLLAAIFAAAIVYQTEWWAIATVTLTLVVLLSATIGLSLRGPSKSILVIILHRRMGVFCGSVCTFYANIRSTADDTGNLQCVDRLSSRSDSSCSSSNRLR